MRVRRIATAAALSALMGAGLTTVSAAPAFAGDPVGKIQQMGLAPYAIYLVKDFGGGAYWNATTKSMFVLSTASAALIDTTTTGQEYFAQASADGRTLLLLVNGAVLVPLQDKL
jgi:hypothetical protein